MGFDVSIFTFPPLVIVGFLSRRTVSIRVLVRITVSVVTVQGSAGLHPLNVEPINIPNMIANTRDIVI
jgi:hypothetical protein